MPFDPFQLVPTTGNHFPPTQCSMELGGKWGGGIAQKNMQIAEKSESDIMCILGILPISMYFFFYCVWLLLHTSAPHSPITCHPSPSSPNPTHLFHLLAQTLGLLFFYKNVKERKCRRGNVHVTFQFLFLFYFLTYLF